MLLSEKAPAAKMAENRPTALGISGDGGGSKSFHVHSRQMDILVGMTTPSVTASMADGGRAGAPESTSGSGNLMSDLESA